MNISRICAAFVLTLAVPGIATATPGAISRGAAAVKFGEPTRAESAAIKRALGPELADELPVLVGHADLNGDGRPDLIFSSLSQDYCGALGCDTGAVLATATGYASRSISLAVSSDTMFVLRSVHKGMHDIRYGNARHIFVWDGRMYR